MCLYTDLFHIIPVCNDTVFNRIFESQNASFGLCFVTNECVLMTHPNHNALVSWTPNNAGEDTSRTFVHVMGRFEVIWKCGG